MCALAWTASQIRGASWVIGSSTPGRALHPMHAKLAEFVLTKLQVLSNDTLQHDMQSLQSCKHDPAGATLWLAPVAACPPHVPSPAAAELSVDIHAGDHC